MISSISISITFHLHKINTDFISQMKLRRNFDNEVTDLNCSRECVFFGFHSVSASQFLGFCNIITTLIVYNYNLIYIYHNQKLINFNILHKTEYNTVEKIRSTFWYFNGGPPSTLKLIFWVIVDYILPGLFCWYL